MLVLIIYVSRTPLPKAASAHQSRGERKKYMSSKLSSTSSLDNVIGLPSDLPNAWQALPAPAGSRRNIFAQSMPMLNNPPRRRVANRMSIAETARDTQLDKLKSAMPVGMGIEMTLAERQQKHLSLYTPLTDDQNVLMLDIRYLLERRLAVPVAQQAGWIMGDFSRNGRMAHRRRTYRVERLGPISITLFLWLNVAGFVVSFIFNGFYLVVKSCNGHTRKPYKKLFV